MNNLIKLLSYYKDLKSKIYFIIRWLICPFDKMEPFLPKKGLIVDVGCGQGVFSLYLNLKEKKRRVLGIDLDQKRIAIALKLSQKLPNIQFKVLDATKLKGKFDGIVLSDVFHHFSPKKQEQFLKKASQLLKPQAVLLLKEINKDDFFRARLSRLWDLILYPQDKINYWSKKRLIKKLEELGFRVKTKKEAFFFPGSTHLYICLKK